MILQTTWIAAGLTYLVLSSIGLILYLYKKLISHHTTTLIDAIFFSSLLFFGTFFVSKCLFHSNILLMLVCAILVLALSIFIAFYFLKEFCAKQILHWTSPIKTADHLFLSEGVSGFITQLGSRTLRLQNGSNDLIFVPYSQILSAPFRISKKANRFEFVHFRLQLLAPKSGSAVQIESQIIKKALLLDGIALNTELEIELISQNEANYCFELNLPILHSFNKESAYAQLTHQTGWEIQYEANSDN